MTKNSLDTAKLHLKLKISLIIKFKNTLNKNFTESLRLSRKINMHMHRTHSTKTFKQMIYL